MAKKKKPKLSVSLIKDIELNDGQKDALGRLIKWYREFNYKNQPVFEISGGAGTGKTTLIYHLIQELGIIMDEVMFMAFVGKATLQMNLTGVPAKTIHSSLYHTINDEMSKEEYEQGVADGTIDPTVKYEGFKFIRKPRSAFDDVKLIVVDEAGMVPELLAKDILRLKKPVIALGDLNQLPPVNGTQFFLNKPDAILTQIMRQAEGSPIIRLANDIIQYGHTVIRKYEGTDDGLLRFITGNEITTDELLDPDIILTGTNAARDMINHEIRAVIHGRRNEYPMEGDKIVCRKNNWHLNLAPTYPDINLTNGMVGYVTNVNFEEFTKHSYSIDFRPEFTGQYDQFSGVKVDKAFFMMPASEKRGYRAYDPDLNRFELGYCLTCHLAQGSQYSNVLIDTTHMFGDETARRQWLYTAVTRASKRVTLIR